MITKNQQFVIDSMKNGWVLWCTHPYKGAKKFVAHLENENHYKRILKKTFFSLLNEKVIEKTDDIGTNRQYQYKIILKK